MNKNIRNTKFKIIIDKNFRNFVLVSKSLILADKKSSNSNFYLHPFFLSYFYHF